MKRRPLYLYASADFNRLLRVEQELDQGTPQHIAGRWLDELQTEGRAVKAIANVCYAIMPRKTIEVLAWRAKRRSRNKG